MITCKKFLEELGAYLDDQTAPELRTELEDHLSECPNCWVITDTTKKTIKVYKGMDPYPIPGELHTKLMTAISQISANRKGRVESSKSDLQEA